MGGSEQIWELLELNKMQNEQATIEGRKRRYEKRKSNDNRRIRSTENRENTISDSDDDEIEISAKLRYIARFKSNTSKLFSKQEVRRILARDSSSDEESHENLPAVSVQHPLVQISADLRRTKNTNNNNISPAPLTILASSNTPNRKPRIRRSSTSNRNFKCSCHEQNIAKRSDRKTAGTGQIRKRRARKSSIVLTDALFDPSQISLFQTEAIPVEKKVVKRCRKKTMVEKPVDPVVLVNPTWNQLDYSSDYQNEDVSAVGGIDEGVSEMMLPNENETNFEIVGSLNDIDFAEISTPYEDIENEPIMEFEEPVGYEQFPESIEDLATEGMDRFCHWLLDDGEIDDAFAEINVQMCEDLDWTAINSSFSP